MEIAEFIAAELAQSTRSEWSAEIAVGAIEITAVGQDAMATRMDSGGPVVDIGSHHLLPSHARSNRPRSNRPLSAARTLATAATDMRQ